MTIKSNQPSSEAAATLACLRKAVSDTLDRKRRLGQYAVVWRDGKPALLDEDVEDRAAFYEVMVEEPVDESASETASNKQPGVVES